MTLELNKLYNMDNMDGMKEFPDKYFELAIVDPPYGIDINMNMGRRKGEPEKHTKKSWDKGIPDKAYFDELFRVSVNQIIWGGQLLSTTPNRSMDILGQICAERRIVCRWRTRMDIA